MKTSNTLKIYHKVPDDMAGSHLFPLNRLLERHPKIAEIHRKKYLGREGIMKKIIPHHNWLWNDILHFSPVHPQLIVDTMIEIGCQRKACNKWFEIDPNTCDFNNENSTIFLHNKDYAGQFEDWEFEEYSLSNVSKHTQLPKITKDYFENSMKVGKPPLMFVGVPHILYHGSLSIDGLNIIEVMT